MSEEAADDAGLDTMGLSRRELELKGKSGHVAVFVLSQSDHVTTADPR